MWLMNFASFAATMIFWQFVANLLPPWFNGLVLLTMICVVIATLVYPQSGIVIFAVAVPLLIILALLILAVKYWPITFGFTLAILVMIALFYSIASWSHA